MSHLNPRDFLLEVAKGTIPGHALRNLFGVNLDVDLTSETIWSAGGIYVFPTAARIHSVVSTSALDTAAGTGARTVRLEGLDTTGVTITETVILAGVVPVLTVASFLRINSFVVLTAGTGGFPAGIITATAAVDTTVSAQIEVGKNVANQLVYTVPLAKRAILLHVIAGSLRNSASNANIEFSFRTRALGGLFVDGVGFTTNLSGDSHLQLPIKAGAVWPAQTDVMGMAISSQTNSDVSGLVQILIVDDGA